MNSKDLADRIGELYNLMTVPLLICLGSASLLIGIWVGSKFLLSGGDEQKIKKAKDTLKHIIVGTIIIFVIAALLPMVIALLDSWTRQR